MKNIYIAPSVEVFEEIVETNILAGSEQITGAQRALTDQSIDDLNLDNNEYDITKEPSIFLEVE